MQDVLLHHSDEADAAVELARISEWLHTLPDGPEHTGLIHYDFEQDNVFYMEQESRFCAIDFDDSMYHWYMMDVSSALTDLWEKGKEAFRDGFSPFWEGYRSQMPLDPVYTKQLPRFQRFSDLYSFCRILRSVERFDEAPAPYWAIQLRDRLMRGCNKNREQFKLPF